MTKQSRSSAGRNRGSAGVGGKSPSARSSANSRMWSEPATVKQIAALKAQGKFDGKYYSKGRAGQSIGESVRGAEDGGSSRPPVRSPRTSSPQGVTNARSTLEGVLDSALRMQAAVDRAETVDVPRNSVVEHISEEPTAEPQASAEPTAVGASAAAMSGVLSFTFFDEMRDAHLRSYQAEYGAWSGQNQREEVLAWADAKVDLANKIITGHNALVKVLQAAPSDAVPDPRATAASLLANASPGTDEHHLRSYQAEYGACSGKNQREEILAWADTRLRLAMTNARALVELTEAEAAVGTIPASLDGPETRKTIAQPKAPRPTIPPKEQGARFPGRVVSINAHGAVLALDTGEHGWLHVSELRVLNDGARVDDVTTYLTVGQKLSVRGVGTTKRGQIQLALANPGSLVTNRRRAAEGDGEGIPSGPPTADPASTTKKRGFFERRVPRGRSASSVDD